MITITIALFGDYWLNSQEVETKIRSVPAETPVHLDFQAEGVSVTASGIQQKLIDICTDTGRDRKTLKLINNPNMLEQTLFENIAATHHASVTNLPPRSHFLSGDLLRSYWGDPPQIKPDARLFGLFIGRRTISRDMILRQCLEQSDRFLFSMMNSITGMKTYDETELQEWSPGEDIESFRRWRHATTIPSLDGKSIKDQYRKDLSKSTNASILEFYDRFMIEIVLETYTRGDSFFPTEKTARPILACKPILVYGPRHFLARLRDLYGYRTYGDHWDESYDQLEGPQRWHAMWRTMQDINRESISNVVVEIANHNRAILEKMKEWLI